jgi:hypothetical protein
VTPSLYRKSLVSNSPIQGVMQAPRSLENATGGAWYYPPPLNKCNSGSKVGTLAGEPQIEISRSKSKTRELDPQSGPHWPVPTLDPRVTATKSAQSRVWPHCYIYLGGIVL